MANKGGADFQALQYEFTAHMRDPDGIPPIAGVEDRRLAIYRDLLYNNIEGFLSNSFPVLRSIIEDALWHELVRHYFRTHHARTPLFPKMPQEFLHYLADENALSGLPPFTRELAHYEWLELEVSLDKREIADTQVDETTSCLNGVPVMNPIARVQAYEFPVHQIGPDFQPVTSSDEPTYLVVYRDRRDKVQFMQLNPITARLLELILSSEGMPGIKLLEMIADELNHPDPNVVVTGGTEILQSLYDRDVLLGARLSKANS